jgi:hypothetical protein
MPASTPRSPSEGGPRTIRPLRAAGRGDEGVSEVIGYLLVFGILSLVLVLSMSAFGLAHEGAKARVVELRAESAAARVAGVVVQSAILAERQGGTSAVAFLVDLPQQLEGLDYTVALDDQTASRPDQVRIGVPALSLSVTSPVFAAGASGSVNLCPVEVGGGPVLVRYSAPSDHLPQSASHDGDHPEDVPAACADDEIFLEVA